MCFGSLRTKQCVPAAFRATCFQHKWLKTDEFENHEYQPKFLVWPTVLALTNSKDAGFVIIDGLACCIPAAYASIGPRNTCSRCPNGCPLYSSRP